MIIDKIVPFPAPIRCPQLGIERPLRSAQRVAEPGPLPVVGDGDGNPAVETAELVDIA